MNALIVQSCCDFLPPAALYCMNIDESSGFLTFSCSNLPQLPAQITARVPFGWVKQNTFCLLVEPSGIQAKLHVGQSEITVNYLCASCPVPCSSQYGIAGVAESGQDMISSCYLQPSAPQAAITAINTVRFLLDFKSNRRRMNWVKKVFFFLCSLLLLSR